jgi:hypothetical protein
MNKMEVVELLDDLGWEYERMSSSGKETLDKLWVMFGQPTWEESFLEDEAPENHNRFGEFPDKVQKEKSKLLNGLYTLVKEKK